MHSPSFFPSTMDWSSYGQFRNAIEQMYQNVVPDYSGFRTTGRMRHADRDGTYYYFPRPQDVDEVLDFTHGLFLNADDRRRSLVVPAGILAAHPGLDGNGRTSRFAHATLAGKSPDEITAMGICTPHGPSATDREAQQLIDLRLPEALYPHIEEYVYEMADLKKRISLTAEDTQSSQQSFRNYSAAKKDLPDSYRDDLEELVVPWRIVDVQDYYGVDLLDKSGIDFALNAHYTKEHMPDLKLDLPKILGSLTTENLVGFVDNIWRYTLLRAKARVACLGHTALGSRIVTLPDCAEPLSVTDHYIRLSNNLVKS